MKMTSSIKHGQIWLANLNPQRGTEPGKSRPVLVLQHQTLLEIEHPSTIIIPLSTKLADDAEPLRLRLNAKDLLEQDSDLLIDQIRAIDNTRVIKGPLLECDKSFMEKVYQAVMETMGITQR